MSSGIAGAPRAPRPPNALTPRGLSLADRNFIIGTADATVYHLTADGTKLDKLFVEPKDAIRAISCHPYQPLIAIGSFCGMIKVWNYEKKTYLFSRVFEKGLGVQSLTYNPEGICFRVISSARLRFRIETDPSGCGLGCHSSSRFTLTPPPASTRLRGAPSPSGLSTCAI